MVWSNEDTAQLLMLWHESQLALVAMWVAVLPGAVDPLWHDAHVPLTDAWSIFVKGVQAEVEWQLLQVVAELICVADLPVADVPLWQLAQVPVTLLWSSEAAAQVVVL